MRFGLFILLFVFGVSLSMGQLPNMGIPKPTINNPVIKQAARNVVVGQLEKSRSEYDTTALNYAISLSDNAGLFENEEKWQKNQKMLLEVFNRTDNQSDGWEENARSLNEVGEMMYASNKFKSADSSFQKSKRLYEINYGTDNENYAKVLANIGLLCHTMGRYSQSEEYTKKALEWREEHGKTGSIGYAILTNNLGVLYKDMGKYSDSEVLLKKALELHIARVGKEHETYAIVLNNMGMLEEEMGRYDAAAKTLLESQRIALAKMSEKSTTYQRMLINLALVYQELKQFDKAEEIYKRAAKIKESRLGTSHPDYAHILNLQGELYVQMKRYTEAETLFKKSSDIYTKKFGSEHPSYASVQYNLGTLYRIQGKINEAATALNKALAIRKKTLSEKHPDYLQSKESIAFLMWQQGAAVEANKEYVAVLNTNIELINEYFAPLSEAEKARFWDKMAPQFNHYASFVSQYYQQVPEAAGNLYNYTLATKALLLNAGTRIKNQILQSKDAALIGDYKKWLDTKENLSRIYTLTKTEITEQKINVDSIEQVANNLEKNLSARSNVFKEGYGVSTINWKNIQAKLATTDAAVEILHVRHVNKISTDTVYYVALILDKTVTQPKVVVLQNGNQLERKYFAYYRNCIKGKLNDVNSYQQYWKNIETSSTASNWYVSLDGVYNQINLHSLKYDDGMYVVDKKNIILVTNTKDVIDLKTPKTASTLKTATLIGYPNYGSSGSVTPLPGTKVELESCKAILVGGGYKVTLQLQNEATEMNARKISNATIVHFATHGFFVPEDTSVDLSMGIESSRSAQNPMLRSGLLLTNAEAAIDGTSEYGILNAYEVMNMDLSKTEITILSACETGLGDVKNGEGVYGLQRAFQVAGSQSLIMSLWKVNDEVTQKLISTFLKNYILYKDKQKAFKLAMLEIKKVYKDPYYWAAFVLVE
ncbi:MAG: CHAT domain-containing tetratricopeptide repeat protein [Cytophagaceae bacterium]